MAATPQERLALGMAALLLVAGAAARVLSKEPASPDLTGPAGVEVSASGLAAQVEDSVERAEHRNTPLAAGERIDPNTASVDDLVRLDGIGLATARRIVAWREAHGHFRTLEDLDAVNGVGPATLEKMRSQVTLPSAGPVLSAAPSFRDAASVADLNRATPPPDTPVNVNTATLKQLADLPEIGDALAARIVEWRQVNGPFPSVDALMNVEGIAEGKLEALRPHVRATP